MKKTVKKITALFIVCIIFTISVCQTSAKSYLTLEGFQFLVNDDGVSATVYGFDNHTTDVVVPSKLGSYNVTNIGNYAFYENTSVSVLSFKNAIHLEKIGYQSFYGCTGIKYLYIPDSIKELSYGSFANCENLAEIKIDNGISELPDYCFNRCYALSNVLIPDSVTSIGSYTFGNCSSLTKITIPKATTSIAANAFKNCPSVTIYGYKDSYAQQYAEENNINFEIIPEYEIGDVDMNGIVNVSDATLVQYYASSIKELSVYQLSLADVNGDGVVNVLDATQIQRILVGFE